MLDNTVGAFNRKGGTKRWSRVLPSRPFTGPLPVGAGLAVVLTTGQVIEMNPVDGKTREQAAKAATDAAATAETTTPTPLPPARLQAATVSPDGKYLYTITISKDYSRTLTAWGRK